MSSKKRDTELWKQGSCLVYVYLVIENTIILKTKWRQAYETVEPFS